MKSTNNCGIFDLIVVNLKLILISLSYFLTYLIFIGCESPSAKKAKASEEGIYEIRIAAAAGDDFEVRTDTDTLLYTPYPYNMGHLKVSDELELSCAVISKRLSKQSRIKIKPIGLLLYKERNKSKKLIVAIPIDEKKSVLQVSSFMDLATKYPAVKNIIQDWTLSRCGIGCATFESWEDDNAAGLYIQRSLS